MMIIVFVVHRFHPNLYYPVKALVDAGHKVEIIVPNIKIYEMLSEDHSIVNPVKLDADKISIKSVYRLLKELKPDIIIHRYFEGKWKLFSVMAAFLGIKRITYDQSPHEGNSFIRQKLRPVRRFMRGQPLRKMTPVLNRGRPGRFVEPFSTYIPFPIQPLVESGRNLYIEGEPLRILCVGKLGQPRKNQLLLLDALEKMDINCSLTFVGAGPRYAEADREYFYLLEKRCRESKLFGGVELLMDLPYKEMMSIYKKHHLLVMPAISETLGQCILEGLAAGLPVISSDDCGAAGYIIQEFNGFVFKRGDEEDLINRILFFVRDPVKIREFGDNALERIETEHSPYKFSSRIEKLMN